jgi:hypothetical protein
MFKLLILICSISTPHPQCVPNLLNADGSIIQGSGTAINQQWAMVEPFPMPMACALASQKIDGEDGLEIDATKEYKKYTCVHIKKNSVEGGQD